MERGNRIELSALAWKAKVLPLYEPRINIFMYIYDAITKTGLVIHLSMSNDHTFYILVFDVDNFKLTMKFFNNLETALAFIQAL